MNVAKWLLLALLMLPLAELAAFIAVAAAYGFLAALGLLLAGTMAGVLVLRHAGGSHIARVRAVMTEGLEQGRFTALQADGTGGLILVGGFLLVIPGFITDFIGLLVLLAVLWRSMGAALGRGGQAARTDGVVDLEPEQWRRVNDPVLPNRQTDRDRGGQAARTDGVVDLEPEQWRRVNDPVLPNRQTDRDRGGPAP